MDGIQGSKPDWPDPLPQWVPMTTNFVVHITCIIYERDIYCWIYFEMGKSAAHTWWIWCFYLLFLYTFANSTYHPGHWLPCCQNLLNLVLYRKAWHAQNWLCSCHKISGWWLSSWYVSISLIATSQSSPPLMYLDGDDEVERLLVVSYTFNVYINQQNCR